MSDTSGKEVRRVAMDLLARREHSLSELSYKLNSRFPVDAVEPALSRLVNEGLQSDERFTEAYVYSRSGKGYGPARIRGELMTKGISASIMADYLFDDDEQWFTEACKQRQKKFGTHERLDQKERARQYRFLAQRGFLSSHINACLD